LGHFILNALDEALILTVMTILSYFLFNIHINILILLVYIKSVEYLWKLVTKPDRRDLAGEEQIHDHLQTQQ
jgi:Ca2+/Na+ antiporter